MYCWISLLVWKTLNRIQYCSFLTLIGNNESHSVIEMRKIKMDFLEKLKLSTEILIIFLQYLFFFFIFIEIQVKINLKKNKKTRKHTYTFEHYRWFWFELNEQLNEIKVKRNMSLASGCDTRRLQTEHELQMETNKKPFFSNNLCGLFCQRSHKSKYRMNQCVHCTGAFWTVSNFIFHLFRQKLFCQNDLRIMS